MSRGIWRRNLASWLPAVVVCALNLGLFSYYRLVYAGEAQARDRLLERRETEVVELSRRHQDAEELVGRVRLNRSRLERFRAERLATEAERLTQLISEVKELARRAGVEPSSIRYPEEPIEEYGLTKRLIVFSVDGDYAALRRFINFLELSELFLTLEEVSLSGRRGGQLRISMQVSTLFLVEPGAEDTGPGGGEEQS